jgi:DNA ligase-1
MSSKKRLSSTSPRKSPKKPKTTGSLDAFFRPAQPTQLAQSQDGAQERSMAEAAPAKLASLHHVSSGDTKEGAIMVEDEDDRPVSQSNEQSMTAPSMQEAYEPATVPDSMQISFDTSSQLGQASGPVLNASSAESLFQYPDLGGDPLTFDASQCPWPSQRPVPYSFLAHVLNHLSRTKSRILLLNTLTNSLRFLILYDPESIVPALYMVSNSISPSYVPVELAVGPKILSSALTSISGLTSAALRKVSSEGF